MTTKDSIFAGRAHRFTHMAVYLKIYDLFLPNDISKQSETSRLSDGHAPPMTEKLQSLERSKFYKFMLNVEKVFYYLQDQFNHNQIYLEDILNFLIPDHEEAD